MKQLRNDNKGAALVYILITVVIAGILTTGLIMLIVNRVRMQTVDEQKTAEYYLADGAVELLKKNYDAKIAEFLEIDISNVIDVEESNGQFPDEQSAPETGKKYLYYSKNPDYKCRVIYYGDTYITEIVCIWELTDEAKANGELLTYEVTQTPRTPSEEEGGDAE